MKKRKLFIPVCLIAVLVLAGCGKPDVKNMVSFEHNMASVSRDSVEELTAGMTYGSIIQKLGATQDVGSGMYVAVYLVGGDSYLHLSFAEAEDVCGSSGKELLEGMQSAVGIRGAVMDITAGEGIITMLVEATGSDYGMYDKASVRVDKETVVMRNEEPAAMEEITAGALVEVVFDGPVAESYPVQGYAGRVRVIRGVNE